MFLHLSIAARLFTWGHEERKSDSKAYSCLPETTDLDRESPYTIPRI